MNLYLVLEGEKTESKIYPQWLTLTLPQLNQIDFFHQATSLNYYLFSGGGIPSIYGHTVNAIKDINSHPVFDYLIVCLDGEEVGVEERKADLLKFIGDSGEILNTNCKLEVIIQNVCIETWFLGNRKIFKKNAQNELLRKYIQHFNVCDNDPEMMGSLDPFRTKAIFHHSYLREIFKEHNLTYKKTNIGEVLKPYYFEQMVLRTEETDHIPTFSEFLNLLKKLGHQLNS